MPCFPTPLEQSMRQVADIQQDEEAPAPRRQSTGILPPAAQPNRSPNHWSLAAIKCFSSPTLLMGSYL